MSLQAPLPKVYESLPPDEMAQRVASAKAQLGSSLVVLGHHYQRDEVIEYADFRGDSLKLAQLASKQRAARTIVFCGVHFMAESADILSGPHQQVCLPHLDAGCSMADMVTAEDFEEAMHVVNGAAGQRVVPIAYVNSSAATKAITARHGGACCTSSNVRSVFEWALKGESDGGAGGAKILAVPDQHLARNTACTMGFGEEACVVYDPSLPHGGLTQEQIQAATFILWKGHCYVHQFFEVEQIHKVRQEWPGVTVLVHPECPRDVVQQADGFGSTSQIIQAIEQAEPGSKWAIGTEANLVNRLAAQRPDCEIRVLSYFPAICRQMSRVDLPHLLWTLENIVEEAPVNVISVEPEVADLARQALERMVALKARGELTWNR